MKKQKENTTKKGGNFDQPIVSGAYPPIENIKQVIDILSNNAYSREECEEVNWDANKIEHLDATQFDNAYCIKLLGGYDR